MFVAERRMFATKIRVFPIEMELKSGWMELYRGELKRGQERTMRYNEFEREIGNKIKRGIEGETKGGGERIRQRVREIGRERKRVRGQESTRRESEVERG